MSRLEEACVVSHSDWIATELAFAMQTWLLMKNSTHLALQYSSNWCHEILGYTLLLSVYHEPKFYYTLRKGLYSKAVLLEEVLCCKVAAILIPLHHPTRFTLRQSLVPALKPPIGVVDLADGESMVHYHAVLSRLSQRTNPQCPTRPAGRDYIS